MIKTSQIIKVWANHDPLSRSRLYILNFQKRFELFRRWICFGLQPWALFPFSTFYDKKLSRLNVRKITELKRQCRLIELRYKAVGRENVARESMLNRKHYALM